METKMIGNKIVNARKEANMSQAQLAQLLFISPQAVGKWERGESIPDLIMFNRLAEILGVDLNYFSENFATSHTEMALTEAVVKQANEPSLMKEDRKPSWDMSRENLVDTDFSGLKNLHEKLIYSNMQRCLFVGSDMSGLLLKSNNVEGCDFTGSDISNSHIQSSHLANNVFKNCLLKETECTRSYFEDCDFSEADFTGMKFKSGGFGKNTIANATWNRTAFTDTQLADVKFEGTLEDCYFENCAFTRVTFQQATLLNTFFKNNRKLKNIQFIDCKADKLTYAFLKNGKADMTGVTLLP
jgi:uncharacterized protein YjbI with pentapeptide repeats